MTGCGPLMGFASFHQIGGEQKTKKLGHWWEVWRCRGGVLFVQTFG